MPKSLIEEFVEEREKEFDLIPKPDSLPDIKPYNEAIKSFHRHSLTLLVEKLRENLMKTMEMELNNRASQPGGVPVAFADGITVAQTIVIFLLQDNK